MDATTRQELCERMHHMRQERKSKCERRLIFFGDAQFSCTMRGNPSIPKKKLLKQMAVRGLTVLLDEYNTSKMCPCGNAELTNQIRSNNGKRVRVHKTDGDVCNVLEVVKDRDEISTIDMMLIAASIFKHNKWPSHLCRPLH